MHSALQQTASPLHSLSLPPSLPPPSLSIYILYKLTGMMLYNQGWRHYGHAPLVSSGVVSSAAGVTSSITMRKALEKGATELHAKKREQDGSIHAIQWTI